MLRPARVRRKPAFRVNPAAATHAAALLPRMRAGDPRSRGARVKRRLIEREAGNPPMARTLITLGIILVVAGLLWPFLAKLGLGRLPGDIVIERGNARIYIPIMTSILVSLVLSLVLWVINR